MRLRNELNFRGYPKLRSVDYFDGEEKSLEVEDFHMFWDLLKSLEANNSLRDWASDYSISKEDQEQILTFLKEQELVEADIDQFNENSFYNRNHHFFNIYKKEQLLQKISKVKVVIVGLGTLGATLVDNLAKLGVQNFTIVDHDVVELKNVAAQTIFQPEHVGKRKTDIIEDYLITLNAEIEVTTVDLKIEKKEDIIGLELGDKDILFKCFDEVTKEIMIGLVELTDISNCHYVSLGYYNDSISAYILSQNEGIEFIHNIYNTIHTDYVISSNRGTILHSMAGAILSCHILIDSLINSNKKEINVFYTIDPIRFTVEKGKINSEEQAYTNFINTLYSSFDLDPHEIENKIKMLGEACLAFNEDLPGVLEVEIISLYQIFELLINIGAIKTLGLQDHYESFMELINEVEENDEDKDKEETEVGIDYQHYFDFITSLKLEHKGAILSVIDAMKMLNNLPSYDERVALQNKTYETLKENSEFLLEYLNNSKQASIKELDDNYYHDIVGLEYNDIMLISKGLENNYEALMLKAYENISHSSSNHIDYLFKHQYDPQSSLSIEDILSIMIESLREYNPNAGMFADFITSIAKSNSIGVVSKEIRHGTNRTYFFPIAKENKIILNYDGTFESIFILFHELGHAYYNRFFTSSFFDDNNKLSNESLAYTFEILCYQAVSSNENISEEFKRNLKYFYNYRINKVLLSNFSSYIFEYEVVEYIKKGNSIDLEKFLAIEGGFEENGIYGQIKFENREKSMLNILLDTSFMFGLYDQVIDPLAYLIASGIADQYCSNWLTTDILLQECLFNRQTSIKGIFKKVVTRCTFEDIDSLVENIKNLLDYSSELIPTNTK